MSLIIKGVDMPKSGKSITYSSKEIIEIPRPHGRLIDADNLLKSIDVMRKNECRTCASKIDTKHCNRGGCWMIFISDFIDNLPTIIEAEGSK